MMYPLVGYKVMNKSTLSPYLNFNGNCAEAMKFYQSVLGGKLTLQTFGEALKETPEKDKGRIMHASLDNDTLSFMASDGRPDISVKFGDNIHLSLMGSDEKQLTTFFTKLSD